MSQIYNINNFDKKSLEKDKCKLTHNNSFSNILLIKALDSFFKKIYDYYYNRGYTNILTSTILDNISYLFSIHFIIFNIYIINWSQIITLCVKENSFNLEITEYISFKFYEENFYSFITIY